MAADWNTAPQDDTPNPGVRGPQPPSLPSSAADFADQVSTPLADMLLQQSDAARVYLANRGNRVYYIAGNDFRNLGNHYKKGDDWNNAWVLTSIPAVTHTLNDSLAFAPTTGWLSTVDDATNWNTMMSNLLD